MVRPSLRSGKRKFRKSISGKISIVKADKVHRMPKCSECKRPLTGTFRGNRTAVRRLSKSQRTPSRPYGGNLCSPCTRRLMVTKARSL